MARITIATLTKQLDTAQEKLAKLQGLLVENIYVVYKDAENYAIYLHLPTAKTDLALNEVGDVAEATVCSFPAERKPGIGEIIAYALVPVTLYNLNPRIENLISE